MQTILGSGGAIGTELAKALSKYTDQIRLVSRNPKKVNDTDELFPADLLNADNVSEAIKGSSIVYVTVGFPYNHKVWSESWPPFIQHTIDACILHNCKLVFFDNIYMYDPACMGHITEDCPVNPASKKGMIRKQIADLILQHVNEGKLTALIARSADFYGPGIKNSSMLTEMVFAPLSQGKKANWMASVNFKHSFTYTPDAGIATAMLGNTESAYNQVWHLPTAGHPMTGKQWIGTFAKEMGVQAKYQVLSRFMARLLGIFIPILKEMPEMMYQYDRDYVFVSEKFEKAFDFSPTSYAKGLEEILKKDYGRGIRN